MVSGKYSVLAGAIAREQSIANISNNLANINTTGYKRSNISFAALLKGEMQTTTARGINYSRSDRNATDYSGGPFRQTDDPLNLAIDGDAFFKVQTDDGVRYTRRGDFKLTADGTLVTGNGLPVLDDGNGTITIPNADINKIAVGDDGTIYTLDPQGGRAEVGAVGLVNIADPTTLVREPDTTFSLEDPAQEVPAENSRVIQGSLELSNVNMTSEMASLIDSYRTFETYHKALKSYSTISEQQEDLGSLG